MNLKLVESLAQIIQSLTPEEQAFLEEKLKQQRLFYEEQQKREQIHREIFQRREGKSFEPVLDEYIYITRDERTAQQDELLRACFEENPNR
ncbi:hypothetical protein [Nostoc sp. FACHB-280]|uniref:hypothetical protein n=1 Tax=Nostoc sp. FACHB-280 TaxID=2692839 RepID=UPI00168A6289|nr:hypothetical protein [Nostoc sp. FACHB-280]MBD2495914.1 hypothetical protein [Nostoc sp. FACHB-280]